MCHFLVRMRSMRLPNTHTYFTLCFHRVVLVYFNGIVVVAGDGDSDSD